MLKIMYYYDDNTILQDMRYFNTSKNEIVKSLYINLVYWDSVRTDSDFELVRSGITFLQSATIKTKATDKCNGNCGVIDSLNVKVENILKDILDDDEKIKDDLELKNFMQLLEKR